MAWGYDYGRGLDISASAPRVGGGGMKFDSVRDYVSVLPRAAGVDQPGAADGMIQNDDSDRAARAIEGRGTPGDKLALQDTGGGAVSAREKLRGTAYPNMLDKPQQYGLKPAAGYTLPSGGPGYGERLTASNASNTQGASLDAKTNTIDKLGMLGLQAAGLGPTGMARRTANEMTEEQHQRQKFRLMSEGAWEMNQILANSEPDENGNYQLSSGVLAGVLSRAVPNFVPQLNKDGSQPTYIAKIARHSEDSPPTLMVFSRDHEGIERPLQLPSGGNFNLRLDVMETLARGYEMEQQLAQRASVMPTTGKGKSSGAAMDPFGEGVKDAAEATVQSKQMGVTQEALEAGMKAYQDAETNFEFMYKDKNGKLRNTPEARAAAEALAEQKAQVQLMQMRFNGMISSPGQFDNSRGAAGVPGSAVVPFSTTPGIPVRQGTKLSARGDFVPRTPENMGAELRQLEREFPAKPGEPAQVYDDWGPGATLANKPRYGKRADGSEKGNGYLGALKRPDGDISTELSVGVNIDNKEVDIPLLVPGLSQQQIDHLLGGGKPTADIMRVAVAHARQRMAAGLSPFAGPGDEPRPEWQPNHPGFVGPQRERQGTYGRRAIPTEAEGPKTFAEMWALINRPGSGPQRPYGMQYDPRVLGLQ